MVLFNPLVTDPSAWMMDKMGQAISPLDVVHDGARNLHAVQRGVHNDDGTTRICIDSLDAPLVSPGTPRLLHFDNTQPQLEHGMHFNLYNNVLGTNFPDVVRGRRCVQVSAAALGYLRAHRAKDCNSALR